MESVPGGVPSRVPSGVLGGLPGDRPGNHFFSIFAVTGSLFLYVTGNLFLL
jgi:hypothetical protein